MDFHLCFTIAEGHFTDSLCFCFFLDINASDDRSSSTIEAKILDVVQMNSVMADSKPNCLVHFIFQPLKFDVHLCSAKKTKTLIAL